MILELNVMYLKQKKINMISMHNDVLKDIFSRVIENSTYKVWIPKSLREHLKKQGWLINNSGYRVKKTDNEK